ncbi:MAG: toprim domain-containing protein, partial [Silvanigrellaceae bacterium]|nr:toprim domain-containing protein [Silvanigrellaceae bacterium]
KLSKGTIEGSAAILQFGMKGSTIFIAEGPETAASIAASFPTATVMTSLGISNIKNLTPLLQKLQGQEVIIAADFDGKQAKTAVVTDEIANTLKQEGLNVRVVYPEPVKDLKKTDWNDVLIHKGKEAVQMQLSSTSIKNSIQFNEWNASIISASKLNTISEQHLSHNIESNQTLTSSNKEENFNKKPSRSIQKTREIEMEI